MARIAGKDVNFSFNSVALEDQMDNIEQTTEVDLPEVTAFADGAPEFAEGMADTKISISGPNDFGSGELDATVFGQIGSGEAAFDHSPTGNAAGANDPHYTGNALVKSYKISADVRGRVDQATEFQVNGATTRAVA